MPIRGRPNDYQPLIDYLAGSTANEVTLTFREIVAIIGRALPEEAIPHAGWWTNASKPPAMSWHALGWRARADRDHLRVVFTRTIRAE